jgi:hypothetical protein
LRIYGGKIMSNSKLVDYTLLSPNNSGKRTHKIDRITPHCFVGQVTAERGAEVFLPESKQASCQYVIAYDGRVALVCDEDNRSWCTSSNSNDQRAITIECASDTKRPYAFTDDCYNKLIELTIDICKRYAKTKLVWINDKDKALAYEPKDNELLITVHRWFANKSCPGDWLMGKMDDYVAKVNSKIAIKDKPVEPVEKKYCKDGDIITLKPGSTYYNGVDIPSWVFNKTLYYRGTNNNGVIFSTQKTGAITGVVKEESVNEICGKQSTPSTTDNKFPYKVKVVVDALNYRQGPSVNYGVNGCIRDRGVYTIVDEQYGWGKLKSGAGWINLDYTKKI